ncbi:MULTISPECIES: exonuclease domain-containing protein [Aerococcus]|nr:exonuclease domain-containing protein [Aerococcus urinae]MDL5184398.1 exonuclease domain-containing protein [Aerococcus mictus]MBU5610952.1 hypothetical protein [Aerococcus urinae]MDK6292105.1 exonuclease domain-containing protein [Aerococcus urinae]MDK6376031.1 exonuclease domain-containing protein [Aerococcus urinae]MDK8076063.1 exonuclease domain-containing protein [Aerococcus urinae]
MPVKYAVVDLETTGTKYNRGDRIIQIGVVFLEGQKKLGEFKSNIQPLIPVPKNISDLTGIQTEDLRDAPLFEDIAPDLFQQLQDCVFVAHNINFDYKFLSASFEGVGLPALDLEGIDTVELIRVLYPQAASYKLGDFSLDHGINLVKAHTAIEDARATAQLLVQVMDKVASLPESLYKAMQPWLKFFIRQSGKYFSYWYNHAHCQRNKGLIRGSFTLNPEINEGLYRPLAGTEEDQDSGHLSIQEDVMNFFDQDSDQFAFLKANSGQGKTYNSILGQLQVALKTGKHLIISFPNNVMIRQWQEDHLQELVNHLGRKVQVAVLKSKDHYLDLNTFQAYINYLKAKENHVSKNESMFTLSLLLWVSETQTGDLAELNHGLRQSPLWEQWDNLALYQNRYHSDQMSIQWNYYQHQLHLAKKADIIWTNHAYLIRHKEDLVAKNLWTKASDLIIDECHQLPQIIEKDLAVHQNLADINDYLNQQEHFFGQLTDKYYLDTSNRSIEQVLYTWQDQLQNALKTFDHVLDELLNHDSHEAVYFSGTDPRLYNTYLLFAQLWEDLKGVQRVYGSSLAMAQKEKLLKQNHIQKWLQALGLGQKIIEAIQKLFTNKNDYYYIISYPENYPRVSAYPKAVVDFMSEIWEKCPSQVLFLSATVNLPESRGSLESMYGIKKYRLYTYPINKAIYANKRLYILSNYPSLHDLSETESIHYLAEILQALLINENKKIYLMLNSKQLLTALKQYIQESWPEELIAVTFIQGKKYGHQDAISRYNNSHHGLLIGLQALTEGLHLPSHSDYYLLARLPFRSPDEVREQARRDYWKERNQSYFYQESLPQMLLRFKQSLGRMLSDQAPAAFIVLDKRLVYSSYKDAIDKVIGDELRVEEVSLDAILKSD